MNKLINIFVTATPIFLTLICTLFSKLFYGTISVFKKTRDKYGKFKSLVKHVNTTHPSNYRIKNIYLSFKLVIKRDIESFHQKRYGLVGKDGNLNYITYYHNYIQYRIPINISTNSPKPSYKIYGYKNNEKFDITEMVKRYMGPNHDFHERRLFPDDFGFSQISFIDILRGCETSFGAYEHMTLHQSGT